MIPALPHPDRRESRCRRYLEALASVTDKTPAGEASAAVCRAVVKDGRRHRALNPWSEKDAALLAARQADVEQLTAVAA
jgi:hypothetical protein